ncbi:MAG TPA: ABC transporter ATP-binding protein, partial [Candidatus Limnocylindrales bacterium]|nr:ABC transporter ATP-binding protein [Candidatus Limnocylindrales bacterium]
MTAAAGTAPVIRVRGLTKRYDQVQAVDGIDFDVAKGEIFGLLGPNGAGKTTTVEILEGLREPDGGDVSVLGVDIRRDADAIKPRIGVSLQTAALYPKLTVTELVDLFRSFYPRARPTREIIDALELGERRDARSQDLSGGQRQRLAVALSLVNDPELVFLDEPTTGLDPAARRSLWGIVEGLKADGRSVLLTTHYMEEAEVLCDRIAIMDHGHVLEIGTVEELVSRRFHERAVRFDGVPGLTHERLGTFSGVTSVKAEGEGVMLYTKDVPATIGAVLAATEALGVEP